MCFPTFWAKTVKKHCVLGMFCISSKFHFWTGGRLGVATHEGLGSERGARLPPRDPQPIQKCIQTIVFYHVFETHVIFQDLLALFSLPPYRENL